jgi:hypothetical protein
MLLGVYNSSAIGEYISVDIGVDFWISHRFGLTKTDLRNAILAKKQTYFLSQDVNGNGIIDLSEIDPVKGKLMPRGTEISLVNIEG